MCQCAERRVAILGAGAAALSGDFSQIAPAASFVASSLVVDAKAIGASALAMARLRLGSRR